MNCSSELLPHLGVTGQEDAGRAVGQEDGHRVVVGLGEKFAGWRGDDIRERSARQAVTSHSSVARSGSETRDLRAYVPERGCQEVATMQAIPAR